MCEEFSKRHTDARDGSAWDKWHRDGYASVVHGDVRSERDLCGAAATYITQLPWGLREDVARRAFLAGDKQALRHG